MMDSEVKMTLEGNYYIGLDEKFEIEISSLKPVNLSTLVSFVHEDIIIKNISQFVGKHGVREVNMKFISCNGTVYSFRSTKNWTSEDNIRCDISNQLFFE